MVDQSLPLRHVREHDLHDTLTSNRCRQSDRAHPSLMPSAMDDNAVASVLHADAVALPVGPLFGGDHTSPFENYLDTETGHGGGSAPADGDVVWFCSECGDGPIASWQNACVSCNHQKCCACRDEKL